MGLREKNPISLLFSGSPTVPASFGKLTMEPPGVIEFKSLMEGDWVSILFSIPRSTVSSVPISNTTGRENPLRSAAPKLGFYLVGVIRRTIVLKVFLWAPALVTLLL